MGTACAELVERLLADRILERLRAAQGVLRLKDTYGAQRLEAACARALYHASVQYRTVKTILAGGFDRHPLPTAHEDTYAAGARFARPANTLFDPDASTRH